MGNYRVRHLEDQQYTNIPGRKKRPKKGKKRKEKRAMKMSKSRMREWEAISKAKASKYLHYRMLSRK